MATQIARNLYDEIHRLHGKRLVLGECGRGFLESHALGRPQLSQNTV